MNSRIIRILNGSKKKKGHHEDRHHCYTIPVSTSVPPLIEFRPSILQKICIGLRFGQVGCVWDYLHPLENKRPREPDLY